jgi:hypothetical protein
VAVGADEPGHQRHGLPGGDQREADDGVVGAVADVGVEAALGGVGYSAQAGGYFAALQRLDPSLLGLLLYTFPVMV